MSALDSKSDNDQNNFRLVPHLAMASATAVFIALICQGQGTKAMIVLVASFPMCFLVDMIERGVFPFFPLKDETMAIGLIGVSENVKSVQVPADATGKYIETTTIIESKLPPDTVMTTIFAGQIVDSQLPLIEQGVRTGSQLVILVHEDDVKQNVEEPKQDEKEEEKKQHADVDSETEEDSDSSIPAPNLMFPPDDSDESSNSDEEEMEKALLRPTEREKIVPSAQHEMLAVDAPDMISLESGPEPRFSMCKDGLGRPVHGLTRASLLSYLQHKAEDGCFEIRCPEVECNCLWDYPFMVQVLDGYAEFTCEIRKELEQKLSANLICQKMNARRCTNCSVALRRSILNKNFSATCVACDWSFCWACQRSWKEGAVACANTKCPSWVREVTCAVLKNCPTKRIDHMDVVPVLRACPTCGQLITHISDCKHMDCPICRKSFCFICVLPADDNGNYQCGYDAQTCRLALRQSEEDLVPTGLRSYSSILGPIDCVSTVSSNHGEDVQEIPDEMTSTEFYEKFATEILQNLEAAGWDDPYDSD